MAKLAVIVPLAQLASYRVIQHIGLDFKFPARVGEHEYCIRCN